MRCVRCNVPCPRTFCHSCATRRIRHRERLGLDSEQYQQYLTDRREFAKAVRGAGKDKVPIAPIKWLERPDP